jgi:hypothetical protein
MGCSEYVKSGSKVTSTTSMVRSGTRRHFFNWDTWKTLCTVDNVSGSWSRYATGPHCSRIGNGPMYRGCKLSFYTETSHTLHWLYFQVHIIFNLKVQGLALFVCITLLSSLCLFQVMYDSLNLFFHLFYHIRPEKPPFS